MTAPGLTPTPRPHALITGASVGIGHEFARQLAAQGYDLTLVARDRDRLVAAAEQIERENRVHVTVLVADLATDEGTSRVVAHVQTHPVDVLVNNAGFGHAGRVGVISTEMQDAMVRVHVLAVHRITQAALPAMLQRRAGNIIIVSSVASFLTSAGNVNYCATKAYERVFAEALAQETARNGIYVQALCPGFTHTQLHDRAKITKRAPAWMWRPVSFVVSASLRAMRARKPTVVIPGWPYKLITTIVRFSPRWLLHLEAQVYRRDR
jgi:short-subunit dehydrogenase